jgi:hypothetical protein
VERRVLDKTDHGNGVSIEEFTEEEVEFTPSPADAARGLKDEGNAKFKAGDLRGALRLYDESLAAHASPAVHANRALVLLGLEEFGAAEAACDAALSGDPGNVKALHRRGVARRRLGRLEAALEDYRAAAVKLPGNAKVDSELAELLAEAVAERKEKQREQKQDAAAEGQAASKGSKKKAVVVIEESESEAEGEEEVREGAGGRPPPAVNRSAVPIEEVTDDESDEEWEVVPPTPPGAAKRRGVLGYEAPRSSSDFERALRALAGSREDLGRYLSLVEPGTFPELLKSSLSPEIIVHLLEGLPVSRHWESPAAGAEALESLAAVARFDINIMLVPSRKKATVAAAFQPLEGGAGVAPDALAALRKKFRL